MRNPAPAPKLKKTSREKVLAKCICGAVELEIDFPAFWAWHDHSKPSRRAHGCAYVTYIGTWKSRFRVKKGAKSIRRFDDEDAKGMRSFCAVCGTPLTYERARSPKWVNIPRALFETRTGREPRYHVALDESPEWSYLGAKLVPLKGYPGVMWERPKQKRRRESDGGF
ncbi:MAG: GFA family protein [Proteobacteria bacterium]|nr:GFA family protein [Pseudomonadota bacterium]